MYLFLFFTKGDAGSYYHLSIDKLHLQRNNEVDAFDPA